MQYDHPFRAFFSYSSTDRAIVRTVYDALRPGAAWLDHAEIEWGDRFLEVIARGIESASDFVLFWSAAAAQSEYVRHETHMAFVRMLQEHAIRIKVVLLDGTELPLHLRPFHFLSVADSENPAEKITSALQIALSQPPSGTRHRFLNRNKELDRIESLINDVETRVVLLHGFKGAGKGATVTEALRRFFDGVSVVTLAVGPGTGPAELALQLNHDAFRTILPETSGIAALAAIEKSLEAIIRRGQFIVIKDCQHWLGDDGEFDEPLPTIIRLASSLAQTSSRPIFLTSTRRVRIPVDFTSHVSSINLAGLPQSHMASLVALWYEIIEGKEIAHDEAVRVAGELHGHPIAAKLAADLLSQFGPAHLLAYPKELVNLRQDLAKTLIGDLNLPTSARRLMETLAIVGAPLPSAVLAEAMQIDENEFHQGVTHATRSGLAEIRPPSTKLQIHPLLSDYFWRTQLDQEDYPQRALQVVTVVHRHLRSLSTESAEFVALLPAVFRLYALAGQFDKARHVRRGLTGELSQAAITHYNRRRYDLAEKFVNLVLQDESDHWRMRTCLARIHVRRGRWTDADELIAKLSQERPRSWRVKHLRGWRLLRAGSYDDALSAFSDVLVANDRHVASYRDAAECLHRLGRPIEALALLDRAKYVESDNPFTLDLEAKIYEEMGHYKEALAAARVATVRNKTNWGLRHRLSKILATLGHDAEALEEAKEAVRLDPAQFVARSHYVSLLIDAGRMEEAEELLGPLAKSIVEPTQKDIYEHLNARIAFQTGKLDQALDLVQRQIGRSRNLAASYGLLAHIRWSQAKQASDGSATARLHIGQAVEAVKSCERQGDHDRRTVESLKARLEALGVEF